MKIISPHILGYYDCPIHKGDEVYEYRDGVVAKNCNSAYVDLVAMCPPFRRSSGFSGVSMPPSRTGQSRKIRSIEVR